MNRSMISAHTGSSIRFTDHRIFFYRFCSDYRSCTVFLKVKALQNIQFTKCESGFLENSIQKPTHFGKK